MNEYIAVDSVRLIDGEGEQVGVVAIDRALEMAAEAGYDLVEISPGAEPPVCKLMDYGKFKYEAQKKAAVARKKQKTIDIKEVKFRPGISQADYDVKLRNIRRFLDDGDKVKITLRFRGREMVHQDLGMKVLMRVRDDLEDISKAEQMAKMEGRQMTMVVTQK
ncbi:MAG: translation initiation factor IF-3 [Proteobacteria bacterium]|nr:translation initiation factor IF-3 [Pseudomonadota bacterium]MDA1354727.1 translation initiation factor IF-3 [Pseudomonadota bacterium]